MIETDPFFRSDGTPRELTLGDYARITGRSLYTARRTLEHLADRGIIAREDVKPCDRRDIVAIYSLATPPGERDPQSAAIRATRRAPADIPAAYARAFQTLPLPIIEEAIGEHMLRHERAAGHRARMPNMVTMEARSERRRRGMSC